MPLQTKDGRQIDVEFVSNLYAVGARQVIQCSIRDITERMQVKRLLPQASETRYRRLFETAKDGILILDAETGKILNANPFILKLLSYRLDECTGKMLWEIGLFKDIEASKEAFDELQSIGYIRYDDLPLETKDGRRIDVEFVSNLYAVGERKVIQCNIRDITERVTTQLALQKYEQRLSEALTIAKIGYWEYEFAMINSYSMTNIIRCTELLPRMRAATVCPRRILPVATSILKTVPWLANRFDWLSKPVIRIILP